MKAVLCSLFVLLVPWCGAEVKGVQGSFKVSKEVLQTARCSKTLSGDASKHIDLRQASDLSEFIVRTSIKKPCMWGKETQHYRSRCVARRHLTPNQLSLEISCLQSLLFDLTREGLVCDYKAGDKGGFSPPQMITTTVNVMDCGLQARGAETTGQGIVPQSYNVHIDFRTQSGQMVLESKDVNNTAFTELVVCNTTAKDGLALCRKSNSSLSVIVTEDVLKNSPSNHASLRCNVRKGTRSVWSGSAFIDKPNESPANTGCTTTEVLCIVFAVLLLAAIVCCVILFVRSKRSAQQQPKISVTAQKLMDVDESPPLWQD